MRDEVIAAMALKCPGLAEIDIAGCRLLTDACLASISTLPALTDVDLSELHLTQAALVGFYTAKPGLRRLQTRACDFADDILLEQLGRHCTSLHTLMVRSCRRITDAGIAGFLRACTTLTDANLSGTAVTTDGVRALAVRCRKLRRLVIDMTRVRALPLEVATLPELEHLVLGTALVVPPPVVWAGGLPAVRAYFGRLSCPEDDVGEVCASLRGAGGTTASCFRCSVSGGAGGRTAQSPFARARTSRQEQVSPREGTSKPVYTEARPQPQRCIAEFCG